MDKNKVAYGFLIGSICFYIVSGIAFLNKDKDNGSSSNSKKE